MAVEVSKRYMGAGGVAVIIALALWLQQGEQTNIFQVSPAERSSDYYLHDAVITTMGPQGQPTQRLETSSLTHYPQDDSADLVKPRLYSYRTDGTVWLARSDSATILKGGATMQLQGAVHMEREPRKDQSRIDIDTRDLWVYPERRYAESEAEVTIRDEIGVTRGKGVRLDMDVSRMRLLSTVRGEYVVQDR